MRQGDAVHTPILGQICASQTPRMTLREKLQTVLSGIRFHWPSIQLPQSLHFVRPRSLALILGTPFLLAAACAGPKPVPAPVATAPQTKPSKPAAVRIPKKPEVPTGRPEAPWKGIEFTEELVPVIGHDKGLKLF